MRRTRSHRGAMLVDTLIASLISTIIGGAILMLMQTTYRSRDIVTGQNSADAWARQSLDILEDSIRNAQSVQISSSPVTNAALSAGGATSITCYTNSAGATARYWLDTSVSPSALKRTTSDGVTKTLVPGVTSLQLTYYTSAGKYANSSGNWVATTDPNAPTSSELPLVAAVKIVANVSDNGYTRQISNIVRLRNSPL